MIKIPFDNSYARLPETFYAEQTPTPVKAPSLFALNHGLAKELGLELVEDEATAEYFAGNKILEGSEPIAMAYSGHQFGGFSPILGDGRAILLGEVLNADSQRYDIQLKGSGRTPFSRGGDGRSALGPVVREYLLSEAMHKLGVPTTRALAAVTTGESVARQRLTPGGIMTRVSSGFVRVGTFQYFASQGDYESLKALADYEIERHYPEAKGAKNPYAALLKGIVERQASLIAKWMSLGFIHGVMNTDNASIAGETIDYGPCAFMDEYAQNRVYSSIDQQGRYAFGNQPQIGHWNLHRLAEAMLPLFEEYVTADEGSDKQEVAILHAKDALSDYEPSYKAHYIKAMRKKVGLIVLDEDPLQAIKGEDHLALTGHLLKLMQEGEADFTLTFHYLSYLNDPENIDETHLAKLKSLFKDPSVLDSFLPKWHKMLMVQSMVGEGRDATAQRELMLSVNPVYIPRNHQVEAAIRAAEDNNDFSKFNELHDVLQNPFEQQTGKDEYMLPPKPEEVVLQTFCGT